jgi:hypothetical protein
MLGVLFSNCSCKNADDIKQNKLSFQEIQIASITYGTDLDAEKWFEYNDVGDLKRQGISKDTIVYEYLENLIIKRHLNKKASWHSKSEFATDQNGRIISSRIFDENDKEISNYWFMYDSVGYLKSTKEHAITSGAKYTNDFMYKEGNLTEVKSYDANGQLLSKYVYEYFPNKINKLNLFMQQISDDVFPNGRFGKKNKNMIKQMTNISKEGDTLSLVTFRYDEVENIAILKEFQKDVLNEFDTELIYHFTNFKK